MQRRLHAVRQPTDELNPPLRWGESKARAAPAQNRTSAFLPQPLGLTPLHFSLDFWRQL